MKRMIMFAAAALVGRVALNAPLEAVVGYGDEASSLVAEAGMARQDASSPCAAVSSKPPYQGGDSARPLADAMNRVPPGAVATSATLPPAADSARPLADATRWVDPFVGTRGGGNCFPGACRPFGLVQPSPDTGNRCSGYKYDDKAIRGFSQTHLNGTGCPGMGDIAILPLAESQVKAKGAEPKVAYDKASEFAEPGYYAVTLEGGVKCEATATERVALWRFTWPEDARRALRVDAASMLMMPWKAKKGVTVPWSEAALGEDRRTISGGKKAMGWRTPYTLFYSISFSEPWAGIERLPRDPFKGKGDGWVVEFGRDGTSRPSLEVRIALSTVSAAGAAANMRAEADGKSFDQIRAEAKADWNALLSRAAIEGSDEQKKNWYTSLYHLFIQPNVQSDADGRYRGADGEIHVAKRGHYSTFSLWDTFRAAHPLYTILCLERVPGFVDSLVAFGEQHGHLPMWTMWDDDTHDMIGIHSIPVVADAAAKGLHEGGEDLLALMVASMVNNDGENPKNCWNAYWENGYIPYRPGEHDSHVPKAESVSLTLELAYDWWCIADCAERLGNAGAAAKARKWAGCWRNVFDEKTGFARPRAPKTAGGAWREPFDPANPRAAGNFWSDFTEANAWIYTWHVMQDPDGLAEALGGREKALAKLDEFFATAPAGRGGSSDAGGRTADGSLRRGQIGQYWHGNEPSHHIAYLYTVWGRPEKTAALVERICREAYRPLVDGLCGNDDCGQMSAWYVFSMMGFYPFNPCGGEYVIGAPQVPRVEIRVPGGAAFTVTAKNLADGACVASATLDGKAVEGWKIRHSDITSGGELSFDLRLR